MASASSAGRITTRSSKGWILILGLALIAVDIWYSWQLGSAAGTRRTRLRWTEPKGADDRGPLVQASRSGLDLSGDLVEGRVGDLVGMHFGGPLNHLRQALEHLGIGIAAV